MTSRIIVTDCINPHDNLALENALLESVKCPTLYLWQNMHTVVVGRNQNAWRECDTALLETEGGTLARRTTGGGAVYHDLGNLNFSFVMPIELYDLEKQLSCILAAVRECGVEAEFSGRNDILAQGRKFSGNAFKFTKTAGLHHGTLLVDSDFTKMGRYLRVSKDKMEAKGVKSVPARVINLTECAKLDIDMLRDALCDAFSMLYGAAKPEPPTRSEIPSDTDRTRFASWDWNYGRTPAFDVTLSRRLDFGEISIGLAVNNGLVSDARIYTDAMDADLADKLAEVLPGNAVGALSGVIAQIAKSEAKHIAEWLKAIGY